MRVRWWWVAVLMWWVAGAALAQTALIGRNPAGHPVFIRQDSPWTTNDLLCVTAPDEISLGGACNALGGGGGVPGAAYVVMDFDGTLSAERKLTAGTGIALTDAGANGNATIAFDYTATLEGNPTLGAGECIFDSTERGILCEGGTADTNEIVLQFPNTAADAVITLPNASTTLVGATFDTQTWGSGSSATVAWTADVTGTSPVLTFGNSSIDVTTGTLKQGGTAVALMAGDLTGSGTSPQIVDDSHQHTGATLSGINENSLANTITPPSIFLLDMQTNAASLKTGTIDTAWSTANHTATVVMKDATVTNTYTTETGGDIWTTIASRNTATTAATADAWVGALIGVQGIGRWASSAVPTNATLIGVDGIAEKTGSASSMGAYVGVRAGADNYAATAGLTGTAVLIRNGAHASAGFGTYIGVDVPVLNAGSTTNIGIRNAATTVLQDTVTQTVAQGGGTGDAEYPGTSFTQTVTPGAFASWFAIDALSKSTTAPAEFSYLYGIRARADAAATSGTHQPAIVTGVLAEAMKTGTVAALALNGLSARVNNAAAGAVTTGTAIAIPDALNTGGGFTNQYQLDIGKPTIGSTINVGLRNAGNTVWTPTTIAIAAAGTDIACSATYIKLTTVTGTTTLSDDPIIADGQIGQVCTLENVDATATDCLLFTDGQGVQNIGNANVTLCPVGGAAGSAYSITYVYNGTDWVMQSAAWNSPAALLDVANIWTAAQTFNDSVALTFGTGGDATILYNGTDLIVDPDVVGAGSMKVNGPITEALSSAGATLRGYDATVTTSNTNTSNSADLIAVRGIATSTSDADGVIETLVGVTGQATWASTALPIAGTLIGVDGIASKSSATADAQPGSVIGVRGGADNSGASGKPTTGIAFQVRSGVHTTNFATYYGLYVPTLAAGDVNIGIYNAATTVYAPGSQLNIANSANASTTTITCSATYMKISLNGTAGTVQMNANPTIADGQTGQICILEDTDATATDCFTFVDGNGIQLSGNTNVTICQEGIIAFIFDGTDWQELYTSNN